jgi:hypothetical protein
MLSNDDKSVKYESLIYSWRVKAMLWNIDRMIKDKCCSDEQTCRIIDTYIKFVDDTNDMKMIRTE